MATKFQIEHKSNNAPVVFSLDSDSITALELYNLIIREAGAVTARLWVDPTDISTIIVLPTDASKTD